MSQWLEALTALAEEGLDANTHMGSSQLPMTTVTCDPMSSSGLRKHLDTLGTHKLTQPHTHTVNT